MENNIPKILFKISYSIIFGFLLAFGLAKMDMVLLTAIYLVIGLANVTAVIVSEIVETGEVLIDLDLLKILVFWFPLLTWRVFTL